MEHVLTYISRLPKLASDEGDDGQWIQAFPYGEWDHPHFGKMWMTPERARAMIDNFRANVRGHDLELDYDHKLDRSKGNKASGWVRDMEARDDGLWWKVAWTPNALQEIRAGEWRYFSPEWNDEWEHPATHTTYQHVAVGGGLTNRPFLKGILPLNASELTLETHMADDDGTKPDPQAQKPDQADHNNPVDPNVQQPMKDKHKEPGTVPDEPDMIRPADDDPDAKKEGEVVDLKAMRDKLGLPDDADEAAVFAAIDGLKAEVEPLRKVAHDFDKKSKFASEYPEEATRLQALEADSRAKRASEFAEQFVRVDDEHGLSTVAREQLETAFLAAESGSLSASDFAEVISTVTKKENHVPLGEKGKDGVSIPLSGDDKNAFAERVGQYQASDNLSYRAAVEMAAKKHPDEYLAYREAVKSVHNDGGEQ